MSKRAKWLLVIGAIAALVFGFEVVAYGASLTGSKFEIDQPDANMVVDGPAGNLDWANVNDTKSQDKPTGGTDNAYQGGVKEDDVCPAQTTGTIPNNKSDLRYFGVYQEQEVGGPGWLHLFWTRVSEPSGATLMDFEFNKSKTLCTTNGSPNVQRTVGDLLIEYKIEGGTDTSPDITLRKWTGTAWGAATTLPPSEAIGAINLSPISNPTGTGDNSDGTLPDGTTSENRTFGEASIDLSAILDPNKCESFGSGMLKSRAGPPFESQLKDFIAPNTGVNIQNCGKVIIRKQTLPDEDPNTTDFGYTKTFNTDPTSANTFTLKDDGVKTFNGVLFGTGKTVTEDTIPTGWQFDNVNCSASTGVTPQITGATVTFAIDAATDVLDCTYTNVQNVTTLGTKPFDYPNDTATVSNSLGSGTPGGSVTFTLYGPSDTANCTGTVRYGPETVSLTNGSASTTNGVPGGQTDFAINSGNEGTYWWKVSYSGDAANHIPPVTDKCVESTDVDITDGSGTS